MVGPKRLAVVEEGTWDVSLTRHDLLWRIKSGQVEAELKRAEAADSSGPRQRRSDTVAGIERVHDRRLFLWWQCQHV